MPDRCAMLLLVGVIITGSAVSSSSAQTVDQLIAAVKGNDDSTPGALKELAAMGNAAARARPAIIKLLAYQPRSSVKYAREALLALDRIGVEDKDLPLIATYLGAYKGPPTAERIVRRAGKKAVPALIEHLGNEKLRSRHEAVHAMLRALGKDAGDATAKLIELSNRKADRSSGDYMAIVTLGYLGSAAKPALETLKDHLRSPMYARCSAALVAVRTLGPYAVELLPVVLEKLSDDKHELSCMEAIAAMGPAAEWAVAPLREKLHSKDKTNVRKLAAIALGAIGPKAAAAVPDLITAMNDEEHLVSYAAIDALGKMGEASAQAVPVMVKMLDQPFGVGEDGRHHVLRALAKLGPKLAAQAGPAAAQIIAGREGSKLKMTAAQTLPKFCPDPPKGLIEEMAALIDERNFPLLGMAMLEGLGGLW